MESSLPRFFKVLMPGFRCRLVLPPAISQELMLRKRAKKATLISRKGRFLVEIRKCKEGGNCLCFKRGWDEFVDHHRLVAGDFLVFKDIGRRRRLLFKVNMFDPTCCEKDFHVQTEANNHIDVEEQHGQGRNEDDDGAQIHKHEKLKKAKKRKIEAKVLNVSSGEQFRQFTMTMKRYNIASFARPILYMPKEYCVANGFCDNTIVSMKGPNGEHQVTFKVYSGGRGFLYKGWREFATSNNLKIGDKCIFKLCSSRCSSDDVIVLDVEVLRDTT
ncbi:unnamed protein product [Cuscuta epithymum]|uniref:TF-B3 domain-containing protein n=1 Tax=Cuscuta epithymum TaxID=186058 RepID=A0AAV0F135_9ASTE|nr:unnamed protein product [Cuscuta epithymum]CAH9129109.1 unnamed protein product [Cuscuta epithymum]